MILIGSDLESAGMETGDMHDFYSHPLFARTANRSNKIHIPRMWSDLCTDSEWKGWAKTNCAKSCNMCGDVDPTVTPTGKRRG